MTNNIRKILTPLLIYSFLSGLRIVEFSTNRWKVRFCLLYILLFWSIFFVLLIYTVPFYLVGCNVDYIIFFCLNIFISLISIIFGVRYNKRFKECLKKITIVDDTLEQLGMTTDFQKFHAKILWLILGWSVMAIVMIYVEIAFLKHEYNYNITTAFIIAFTLIHCSHVNVVSDLIIASILGYIGLKFDQINENLEKLANDCGIKHAWESHILHARQRRHLQIPSNKCITWIVIHLHLDLCKVSREINSMFGIQLTFKMGLYFGLIAACLRAIFSATLISNYIDKRNEFLVIIVFWCIVYAFQVLLINYICERVSVKANTIGNFINRISYSTCDIEVRENISQLLFQVIQSPLRFYGIRLFQFGYKFLYGLSASIATVVVILVQAHINTLLKKDDTYNV